MRGDWDALSEIADVVWHNSDEGPGWRPVTGPTGWLPDRRVRAAVAAADLVFQWFATPCAPVVAAQLLRRPSIVIAGGYDVAAVPEISYGRMLHLRTRLMGRLALNGATQVLAVSRSTLAEVLHWAPKSRAALVYHGLDQGQYRTASPKKRQAITVATLSEDYFRRKGLDVFARASRSLPAVPFVLAGRPVQSSTVSKLRELAGGNLVVTGYLPDAELRALLAESAVYVQLSLHEGFGYAVAEAMLSGCQPVVTRAGALPEVVGELGILAETGNEQSAAEAIRIGLDRSSSGEPRDRIARLFTHEARRSALHDHVLRLLNP